MKKSKVEVMLKVKIKNCDVVFKEELGPGVIAMQVVTFPDVDRASPMFLQSLLFYQDELVNEIIEVESYYNDGEPLNFDAEVVSYDVFNNNEDSQ